MVWKIARTQSSTCAKPRIWFIYQNEYGFMKDVHAIAYEIFDLTVLENELDPPVMVAKTDLNPTSCTPEGGRLGNGRYCVGMTIPGDWDLGTYLIRWYVVPNEGDDEVTFDDEILVTDQAHGSPDYWVTVQDMYDSGVPEDVYTPKQVQKAIKLAQQLIEKTTGRSFEPVYKELKVDGRGRMKLILREPIVAIDTVSADYDIMFDWTWEDELESVVVYNRHMRGQLKPDDRNNPKLEFTFAMRPVGPWASFPDGSQDVRVSGVFGYTTPDGTPFGVLPEDIAWVLKKIAWKYTPPSNSPEAEELAQQYKIVGERTRDQTVTYANISQIKGGGSNGGGGLGSATYITGDPEVDAILLRYRIGMYATGA